MDALAGLLDGPRARGAFLLRASMDPPWSLRIQDEAPLTLVAVVRGQAWIVPDGGGALRLGYRDVAVIRGPEPYIVADDPATPPQAVIHPGQRCTSPDGQELKQMTELGVRTWGNSPDGTAVLLTGTYHLDGAVSQRLLRALPVLLVLREGDWDCPLIPLLADEIVKDEPGQEAVLDRLLDLLLIAVLRAWFARPGTDAPRWYRAYGDPVVGRVPREPGPAFHRTRRRAAHGLPDQLAPRPGRRPAARARRHHRRRGIAGRLRQPGRAQHRLQARPRRQPAAAPHRRVRAEAS